MLLIDEIKWYTNGPLGYPYWSHLASDRPTPENVIELHRAAQELGLEREWLHDKPDLPHYDLNPRMRDIAISRLGAQTVSSKDLIRRCSRKYAQVRTSLPSLEHVDTRPDSARAEHSPGPGSL